MFDTNIFNRILDGALATQPLIGCVAAHATHIQRDELDATKDLERRAALGQVFVDVIEGTLPTETFVMGTSRLGEARLGGGRVVPTESVAFDVSRWGEAKWGDDGTLYTAIKESLDKLNRSKRNNVQDTLIAETAIKGNYVLVTEDRELAAVAKKYGGRRFSVDELLNWIATSTPRPPGDVSRGVVADVEF